MSICLRICGAFLKSLQCAVPKGCLFPLRLDCEQINRLYTDIFVAALIFGRMLLLDLGFTCSSSIFNKDFALVEGATGEEKEVNVCVAFLPCFSLVFFGSLFLAFHSPGVG